MHRNFREIGDVEKEKLKKNYIVRKLLENFFVCLCLSYPSSCFEKGGLPHWRAFCRGK